VGGIVVAGDAVCVAAAWKWYGCVCVWVWADAGAMRDGAAG
jgi:hypothetical protein